MAEDTNPTDLLVQFFTEPVEMASKSEAAGRPIYEDREHIRLAFPNDMRTEIVRLVEEGDKRRFPDAYKAFKDEQKKSSSGTPVEEWPRLSKSRAKELKAIGVDTVEQIANMGDMSRERLGPEARELIAEARAFLATAKGTAETQHIAAENERLKDEAERLKNDLAEAQAANKKLSEDLAKAKKAA